MGIMVSAFFSLNFDPSFLMFAGKEAMHKKALMSFDGPYPTADCGVNCPSASTKSMYNGENVVSTLAPLFLIESSSFLQVMTRTIKSLMISKFNQIRPRTSK